MAKPAEPFGGIYRLIDFTLSNCINSDVRKVGVVMQAKFPSLHRHRHPAWNLYRPELGEYIFPFIRCSAGTAIGFMAPLTPCSRTCA